MRWLGVQINWHEQDGQNLIEYMLLLGFLVALVISAMNVYTGPLGALYELITSTFSSLLSGSAM
ncbi:MAG: hypothetical protein R2932_53410 [Caldilineaceae bacterium]